MFQLVKERIVKKWPITIAVPMDGGKVQTCDITLDFKLVGSDEFRKLSAESDSKLFSEVVLGWSGIHDENDQSLPFTPDNLTAACQNQHFTAGALQGYMKAMSGVASTKNS